MHSDGIYLEPLDKNNIELKSQGSYANSKDIPSLKIEFKTQKSYVSVVSSNNEKLNSNCELIMNYK